MQRCFAWWDLKANLDGRSPRQYEPSILAAMKLCTVAKTAKLDSDQEFSLRSPFSVPSFVLELVVIQRRVVQIKAIKINNLIALCGRFAEVGTARLDNEVDPSLLVLPHTPNLEPIPTP